MGLWDVFDNVVKKPVTKAYQCTHDLGRIVVSKTIDGAVEIPTVTKSVLTSSYTFGCAAASKTIDGAVEIPTVTKSVLTSSYAFGCAAASKTIDGAVEIPTVTISVLTSSYAFGCAAVSKTIDGAVEIPTVTKSVLTSSYAFGCAAVSKIDESVGNDGVKQMVKEYLPSPESREKIVQAFTHPATMEALRFVAPGLGRAQAAYNIVGSVLLGNYQNENDIDEQNKYEQVIEQLKVLQAEIEKMQKQITKLQILTSINSSKVVSEQKPEEDIITESMTLPYPKIKDL